MRFSVVTKKVLPFKGILYNQDKVSQLSEVVTPPYDVINQVMQEEFYNRHPNNFCRVDLTKEEGDTRYSTAKDTFQSWLSEEVLIQDTKPALYIHHHTFTLPNGDKIVRKGFFAARKIEDFSEGGIKPHEKTLEGPKTDRLKLTRATKANLSPVFSLYSDPSHDIDKNLVDLTKTAPFIDFVSEEGERHQVWKLTDSKAVESVGTFLEDRPLFIADGHHRYETALNYRNEVALQEDLADNSAANYLLMYFSNMDDDGLVILPIHRALHSLVGFDLENLLNALKKHFEVEAFSVDQVKTKLAEIETLSQDKHAFLMMPKGASEGFVLSIDRQKWLDSDVAKSVPESLAPLDVTVLHRMIFQEILGISEEAQANQENIIYWKSTKKALEELNSGKCELTFLLNSTRMEDMKNVALAGEKMPQKSTYFYPKIISGLVVHSVDAKEKDGL